MSGFKIFIRASSVLDTTSATVEKDKKRPLRTNCNDGEKISKIYEDIVGLNEISHNKSSFLKLNPSSCNDIDNESGRNKIHTDTDNSPRRKRTKVSKSEVLRKSKSLSTEKPKGITETQKIRLKNGLLKSAQEGDVDKVEEFISQGVDINHSDVFGWTALMCAAHEGHMGVVRWLLENGADPQKANNQQKTAYDLSGNRRIRRLISRFGDGSDISRKNEEKSLKFNIFYCDVCKEEFSDTAISAHETSTLHLFNCQAKPTTTHYFIPPANRGFQMMLKKGWMPDQGLGNDGKGRKFPIKTVLKRDREGLGGEKKPKEEKVTHFQARDERAVQSVAPKGRNIRPKTCKKRDRMKKLTKDQAKEAKFRREFY